MRRIDSADTRQFRESHSFPVAIIGGKHYVAIQTIRGIQFWDVTDVATAAKVGNIDLPGVNAGDYENVAWQTSWQGRYLFVSGGNLGVFVVDAANPAQPKLVKTVTTGATGGFRVGPLYAVGDYLVYSNMDQNGSLGVLDISKAGRPDAADDQDRAAAHVRVHRVGRSHLRRGTRRRLHDPLVGRTGPGSQT